jgi:hypothetical protein
MIIRSDIVLMLFHLLVLDVFIFLGLYRIFLFVLSMISVDGFFNQLVGDMK